MKIFQNIFVLIFSAQLLHLVLLHIDEDIEEDEEIVYGSPAQAEAHKMKDHIESVKSSVDSGTGKVDVGYDFARAVRFLYANYTNIELMVSDLDFLYKKGIVSENQAILIWETLLNSKTERNLEWLGYNKLTRQNEQTNDKSFFHHFRTPPELSYFANFIYFGGFFLWIITKLLSAFPKFNIWAATIFVCINLSASALFYFHKYYFNNFLCMINCVFGAYISFQQMIILSGNNDTDYSIFYLTHFKSREHFLVKLFISVILLIPLMYLSAVAFRYLLNYLIVFYFMEKARMLIINYYKLSSPKYLQPFENFVTLVFAVGNLIYAHSYYFYNIYYSYDLNSFLIINNFIVFYYLTSLDKFIYIERSRLGGIYLECEMINDRGDKFELFEEFKKKLSLDKQHRDESFSEENIIDVILILSCYFFLMAGFYFNTYFYLLISLFILHTLHKNCLIYLSIKISRLISNFFLISFLLIISNLENLSFSYINEIIAVYDQKLIDALLLLFKLLFLISLAICNYVSEDFVDLFNIYNYSSYKYLYKESISNNPQVRNAINDVYTLKYTLSEIFSFDLQNAIDCVNGLFDTLHGSHIEGFYVDYLITKNTSNIHLLPLFCDYFLMYFSYWILLDTFRNNNNSFFYITFVLHKLGLFSKLVLLIFEYSKTNLQKYTIIVLNIIFILRLLSNKDADDLDRVFLVGLFLASLALYILIFENSVWLNLFILFYTFILFNNYSNSLAIAGIIFGMIVAKNIIHFMRIKHFELIIFAVCAFNSILILSNLKTSTFEYTYLMIKRFFMDYFKINLIGILEDISFSFTYEYGLKYDIDTTTFYFENRLIKMVKDALHMFRHYSY
jgi:hypothetical protein